MKRFAHVYHLLVHRYRTWNKPVISGLLVLVLTIPVVSFIWVAATTYGDPMFEKQAREHARTAKGVVADVTELYPVSVRGIIVPTSEAEIVEAVKAHDRVSIGGGRNSMGGGDSERASGADRYAAIQQSCRA